MHYNKVELLSTLPGLVFVIKNSILDIISVNVYYTSFNLQSKRFSALFR